jgi:hypothetical protein
MKSISVRLAILLSGIAFVLFLTVPQSVQADEWNLETKITPNHDLEVPNAVLEANQTYILTLMDSPSERRVVRVFNEDRSDLLTTFFAVSAEKMKPVDETTFEFMEVPAGYPVPVDTWFYPGRRIGLEFIYPKDQEEKFASYFREASTEQIAQAEFPRTEERGLDQGVQQPVDDPVVDDPVVIDDGSSVTQPDDTDSLSPSVEPDAPTMERNIEQDERVDELPATAGELQLLGLLGGLATSIGVGIRLYGRS